MERIKSSTSLLFVMTMILSGVASFLIIEYIFGVKPCLLCRLHRIPYYAGFAVSLFGLLWPKLSVKSLGLIGLIFFCAICMGVFHILVESGTILFSCNAGGRFKSIEELRAFLYANKSPDCTIPYLIFGFRMSLLATFYSSIISFTGFFYFLKGSKK